MKEIESNARITNERDIALKLSCVTIERDAYKRACQQAGVCMTCVVSAPDTFGCADCLNTGWVQGDPYEQIKVVGAELDAAKAEAERIRAFISDAGYETIRSEQEWKRRAIAAEKANQVLREAVIDAVNRPPFPMERQ